MGSDPEERPRVLVVDDAPQNLRLLSGILRADCRISVATCGRDAIDLARARHPALILLDVMLPDIDGFEVCRRLKAEPTTRDIPVIFVTALAHPEDVARGLALGAADFIGKPVDPTEVLAKVWGLLRRSEGA